jgi:hypothetical protein
MSESSLASSAEEICPGHPIDLGIVRAVKVLRAAGFETFESCEGGEGHAYAEPTVRFEGGDDAGLRALDVALASGLPVSTVSRGWCAYEVVHRRAAGQLLPPPFWTITFSRKLD